MALMNKAQFSALMRAYGDYRGYAFLPNAIREMYVLYINGLRNDVLENALSKFDAYVVKCEAVNSIDNPEREPIVKYQVRAVLDFFDNNDLLDDEQITCMGIKSPYYVISKIRKLGYDVQRKNKVYKVLSRPAQNRSAA